MRLIAFFAVVLVLTPSFAPAADASRLPARLRSKPVRPAFVTLKTEVEQHLALGTRAGVEQAQNRLRDVEPRRPDYNRAERKLIKQLRVKANLQHRIGDGALTAIIAGSTATAGVLLSLFHVINLNPVGSGFLGAAIGLLGVLVYAVAPLAAET